MKKEKEIYREMQSDCHPDSLLAGVSLRYIRKGNEKAICIGRKSAGDPGQKPSEMTANLNVGQVLPDNRKYLIKNNSCVVGPEQQLLRTSALSNNGFTLIELLVVVLIIGVLATVALPQYQRAVIRARYQQAVAFGALCIKAEEIYKMEHGKYTLKFDDFAISIPSPSEKTNYSTVYYSWGYCQLRLNSFGEELNCYVKNAPRYQVQFSIRRRTCFGGKHKPNFNAVCQAETGKQEPDTKHPTADWWSWDYEN